MNTLVDYETRPMTSKESEFFMKVHLCGDIPLDEVLAMSICKLIHNRLPECFEVDAKLLLLVGELSGGSPGNGVMWAYTLFKNNIHNLDDLTFKFADGFPTDEAYHSLWLSQKVHDEKSGDNLLDRPDTWK